MKNDSIFFEIPCLVEVSEKLHGLELQKKWFSKADKRYIGQYLQKFISYNQTLFDFLGVTANIHGIDADTSIFFRTSSYIGTIPLRSPDTGKQIGDFVITPRFSEKNRYADYIKILDLLKREIDVEVIDSIPLSSKKFFQPPLYSEALKFIRLLEELIQSQWQKFNVITKKSFEPIGKINWNQYALSSYNPENRLRYEITKNVLTENHQEYNEICFVYYLCKREILSHSTPYEVKLKSRQKIQYLDEKLYFHTPKQTKRIQIKNSDSLIVKQCKTQANKILNYQISEGTGWRVDFSDVFEKFVQYIFKEVAKEIGGRVLTNYRFSGYSSSEFTWSLRHLEPDTILQKEDLIFFVDAKYKSHLYNKWSNSDFLKEEFRHDLHQILGYSSFSLTKEKFGFLCYPSDIIQSHTLKYSNPINQSTNFVFLMGVPFNEEGIKLSKTQLLKIISEIQKEKYD